MSPTCPPHRWLGRTLLLGLPLFMIGCAEERTTFVTEPGLGPDKWATAWLLTQRAQPGADLLIAEVGKAPDGAIPFDMPGAALIRQGTTSAFEVAVRDNATLDDPDLRRLATIVHDIEIGAWGAARDPDSPLVESAFRTLQETYGRDAVLPACYFRFFDGVEAALEYSRTTGAALNEASLMPDCEQMAAVPKPGELIAQVPINHLLSEIHRGKTVVFVDVREPDEFAEARIPGARNIPIRDVSDDVAASLKDADYVVSYCIKDFRGFEMAKALKLRGVEQSVILSPYGIRGWTDAGLPTAGDATLGEEEAKQRLAECAARPETCLKTPGVKA
ncbi:MAG: chromate resistance protein ChrB domain-containing protein [Silanimonas sp.]